MAKIGKKPLDDQELEGGGAGAGISGTKWSSMPSLKGSSSMMDDFKKIGKDTSHLKGGAKNSADAAKFRAMDRTAIRGAGAGAAVASAKVMGSKDAAAKDSDNYEDMSGEVNLDSSNPTGVSGKGMAKGGTASSRADGCAQRGKTKGTIVMCGGGMYKK
jgi:hypothetical protein